MKKMNLYLGNLLREVTEEDLRQLFEPFGKIDKISVIKDKFSGVSKGFGFIEMPVKEEAEAAIKALHRQPFKGQSMDITEARPREERKRPHGGRSGGNTRRFR
jgi:RNA recognition motif-containing protein